MARLSPEEIAEKFARRTSAAGQDFVKGVESVTEAPGAKAAANREGYLAGVNAQADQWERNVQVPLDTWKQSVRDKGASRYTQGTAAGASKLASYFRDAGPELESIRAQVERMPNASIEDRIARSAHWQRESAKLRGKHRQRG